MPAHSGVAHGTAQQTQPPMRPPLQLLPRCSRTTNKGCGSHFARGWAYKKLARGSVRCIPPREYLFCKLHLAGNSTCDISCSEPQSSSLFPQTATAATLHQPGNRILHLCCTPMGNLSCFRPCFGLNPNNPPPHNPNPGRFCRRCFCTSTPQLL